MLGSNEKGIAGRGVYAPAASVRFMYPSASRLRSNAWSVLACSLRMHYAPVTGNHKCFGRISRKQEVGG